MANKYLEKAAMLSTAIKNYTSLYNGAGYGYVGAKDGDKLGGALTGIATGYAGGRVGEAIGHLAPIEHTLGKALAPVAGLAIGSGVSGYLGGKLYSKVKEKFHKGK